MGCLRSPEWRKLPVSLTELCINTTLRCGQTFRWRKSANEEWSCALHGRILTVRQDKTHLHYKTTFPAYDTLLTPHPSSPGSEFGAESGYEDSEALIRHYFNLVPNLTKLYKLWSAADSNFREKAPKFTGVRILRQDAWEALVGFICSSNNNILRISQMVDKLCRHYGRLIGYIGTEPYHDFPPPSALTGANVEQHLRELGFGYRAKYLYKTAVIVATEKECGWLDALRNPDSPQLGLEPFSVGDVVGGGREGYRKAHEQLLQLDGVGPKVADCVCLMGLGWGEAVPVDTHVWQIAQRDYKLGKGKHSSLTKATYDAVGNRFRSLWGQEAGWAHSVLFTADLRVFSERHVTKSEKRKIIHEIKMEGDILEGTDKVIKENVMLGTEVKKEIDEVEQKLFDLPEDMMSSIKRRRRGRA